MRGTILFVHGTGVRGQGLAATQAAITAHVSARFGSDVAVSTCDWGDLRGPDLVGIAAALPEEAAPDASMPDHEDRAEVWGLLISDPLFELRIAAEAEPVTDTGPAAPGAATPDVTVLSMLQRLESFGDTALLDRAGVSAEELASAGAWLAGADELIEAAVVLGSAGSVVTPAARAIVAHITASHLGDPAGTDPPATLDPGLRSELVERIAEVIDPSVEKGIGDWFKRRINRFAGRIATNLVVDRRRGTMNLASPAIADILYYQQRGDKIRSYVGSSLAGLESPVVAVGHSLGGVILVDLLAARPQLPVDLLVTVGSQSPLFYAIDALHDLRPGSDTTPFRPWVNIYNPDDLLSFTAERVFSDFDQITDVRVDASVPFPWSHSAYWTLEAVYRTIEDHWPR
jgi:hypothetical protein